MDNLIVRDDSSLSISFTAEAEKLRNQALTAAETVNAVVDSETQAWAVTVQTDIQKLLKAVEAARVACKAPVLDFGRKIDNSAKEFRAKLDAEMLRITRSIGDFQTLEQARLRAAKAALKPELDQLELERQEAMVAAKSHDELDAINDEYCRRSQALTQSIPAPVKAEGQTVRSDWEITRINEMVLCRARPDLVRKIEFDMRAVKEELSKGVKLPGVEAKEIFKSGVRMPANQVIDV